MKKINYLIIFIFLLMFLFTGSETPVFSETYDIKEMTPEVKTALDSRRARFDQLKEFKRQGVIGENNKGYVELLVENTEAKNLVEAENKDRRFIYTTIVQQNNLSADALSTVESVFAQVQRDKASTGDKMQGTDGVWRIK